MKGSRWRINSNNASKSCRQCSNKEKENNRNWVRVEAAIEGIFIETVPSGRETLNPF